MPWQQIVALWRQTWCWNHLSTAKTYCSSAVWVCVYVYAQQNLIGVNICCHIKYATNRSWKMIWLHPYSFTFSLCILMNNSNKKAVCGSVWTVSAVNITSFNVLSEKHSCHFTLQFIRVDNWPPCITVNTHTHTHIAHCKYMITTDKCLSSDSSLGNFKNVILTFIKMCKQH